MTGWKNIIITDAANTRFTGPDAREFVKTKLPHLWPRAKPHRNVIWLIFCGKTYIADAAVTLLETELERIGASVERISKATELGRLSARVRREKLNTIEPEPTYELTLELGDINLLFEPVRGDDAGIDKGIQQRLQALGYLYTPLVHSQIAEHARKCWSYYGRVHNKAGAELRDALQRETRGNILASRLPVSGEILPQAQLPAPGDFAAIRFPGGYAFTLGEGGNPGGVDAPFQYKQAGDPYELEAVMVQHHPTFGKIPLVATVTRILPSGAKVPAVGVTVYFQLLPPKPVRPGHRLAPAPLRDTVMDYSVDARFADLWGQDAPSLPLRESEPPAQLTADDWLRAKALANELWRNAMNASGLLEEEGKFARAEQANERAVINAAVKNADIAPARQKYEGWVNEQLRARYAGLDKEIASQKEIAISAKKAWSDTESEIESLNRKIFGAVQTSNKWREKLKLDPHPDTELFRPKAAAGALVSADSAALPDASPDAASSAATPEDIPQPSSAPAMKLLPPPKPKAAAKGKLPSTMKTIAVTAEQMQKNREAEDVKIAAGKTELARLRETLAAKDGQYRKESEKLQALQDKWDQLSAAFESEEPVRKEKERGPDAAESAYKVADESQRKTAEELKKGGEQLSKSREAAFSSAQRALDAARGSGSVTAGARFILREAWKQYKNYDESLTKLKAKDLTAKAFEATKPKKQHEEGAEERIEDPLRRITFPEILRMLNAKPPGAGGRAEIQNAGPAPFIADVMRQAAGPAKNPQKGNAPSRLGGVADLPVPGNVFATVACPRFNEGHASYGALPLATDAADPQHPDAVSAVTNQSGHAGVIFVPSRCGGDTYRLRAYLNPDVVKRGQPCPEQRTGTMVVWRNIRIARYYQKNPIGADVTRLSPAVKALIEWPVANSAVGNFKYNGAPNWAEFFKNRHYASGLVTVNFGVGAWPREVPYRSTDSARAGGAYRPVDVDFPDFATVFRQCYCEVLVDTRAPERLPDNLHEQAIRDLRSAFASHLSLPKNLDWETLIFHDPHSPFLVNIRHWAHYNHLKRNGYAAMTQADTRNFKAAMENVGAEVMMKTITDGGCYPGLTLIQAELGDSWDKHAISDDTLFTSGIASACRAAFIFYTDATHRSDRFCYSATSNAVHELGHVLMGNHQTPIPGGDPLHHQPQPRERATPSPDQAACVMGYMGCYGEFCGRCNLRLRGFRTRAGGRRGGA